MKYNVLTGTGIKVSELCLGTVPFGGQTNEKDTIEIVDYALGNGINFIDTADFYNEGNSEMAIGKAIKGHRNEVILATKVFFPIGAGINDCGLNRNHIISGVERSLRNLGTDYIDIYYMHAPDYNTPMEESLETMSSLVRSGKVRYIGVSNFASWQICEALWISDKRNGVPPVVTQNGYNLISRNMDQELVPFVKKHKMGLVIYQPIAAGLLTGKYKFGSPFENTRFAIDKLHHDRYWVEANFVTVGKLAKIAEENSLSLLELAMKWCIGQDFVDSTIIGVSRLEQLKQNIAVIQGQPLSQEILDRCDEIWQAHVGSHFHYNR